MSTTPQKNLYSLFLGCSNDLTSPNHYELLGIELFTSDSPTIRDAAARQNGKLLSWQNSKYHKQVREIILDLVEARAVLLNPERKRVYDQKLRSNIPTSETPIATAIPLLTSLDTETPIHRMKSYSRSRLVLGALSISFSLFFVLLFLSSLAREAPKLKTSYARRSTESSVLITTPMTEDDFEIMPLANLDTIQSPATSTIILKENKTTPQSSKAAVLIVKELDTILNETAGPTNTHARDEFSTEIEDDSIHVESEPSELLPELPILTRRTRTIFPLSPYRLRTGNLTFKNLDDLAFVGPEGNINQIGDYKTDGEWGIDRRGIALYV